MHRACCVYQPVLTYAQHACSAFVSTIAFGALHGLAAVHSYLAALLRALNATTNHAPQRVEDAARSVVEAAADAAEAAKAEAAALRDRLQHASQRMAAAEGKVCNKPMLKQGAWWLGAFLWYLQACGCTVTCCQKTKVVKYQSLHELWVWHLV
jgi:hypothetical protein